MGIKSINIVHLDLLLWKTFSLQEFMLVLKKFACFDKALSLSGYDETPFLNSNLNASGIGRVFLI